MGGVIISPYEVLGLTSSATPEECKKAYRKLMLKHHPDRGGNEKMFFKVREAYEVITSGTLIEVKPVRRRKVVHNDLFDFRAV